MVKYDKRTHQETHIRDHVPYLRIKVSMDPILVDTITKVLIRLVSYLIMVYTASCYNKFA